MIRGYGLCGALWEEWKNQMMMRGVTIDHVVKLKMNDLLTHGMACITWNTLCGMIGPLPKNIFPQESSYFNIVLLQKYYLLNKENKY